MTHREFLKLCEHPPKQQPPRRPAVPAEAPYHPERLKDPRWQWKPFCKRSLIHRLKASGRLDESRLQAHFARTLSAPNVTGAAHGVTA